jgi:hypothetical protein
MLEEEVFFIFRVLDESAVAHPSGQLTMIPPLETYVSWEVLCSPKVGQKIWTCNVSTNDPSTKRTMTTKFQ